MGRLGGMWLRGPGEHMQALNGVRRCQSKQKLRSNWAAFLHGYRSKTWSCRAFQEMQSWFRKAIGNKLVAAAPGAQKPKQGGIGSTPASSALEISDRASQSNSHLKLGVSQHLQDLTSPPHLGSRSVFSLSNRPCYMA